MCVCHTCSSACVWFTTATHLCHTDVCSCLWWGEKEDFRMSEKNLFHFLHTHTVSGTDTDLIFLSKPGCFLGLTLINEVLWGRGDVAGMLTAGVSISLHSGWCTISGVMGHSEKELWPQSPRSIMEIRFCILCMQHMQQLIHTQLLYAINY